MLLKCPDPNGQSTRTAQDFMKQKREQLNFFSRQLHRRFSLLLFGGGFDAIPVIQLAKNLGWRVSVIDHRPALANSERLFHADDIIVARAEDLDVKLFDDPNSVAVLMTHNYERDREILRRLLNSKVKYIGALGPKIRTQKMLSEIGGSLPEGQLKRLYSPVGLDVGAETPDEIALAIVAEIKARWQIDRGDSCGNDSAGYIEK